MNKNLRNPKALHVCNIPPPPPIDPFFFSFIKGGFEFPKLSQNG